MSSFSYLEYRNPKGRGSFDTGSDDAVFEHALENAEKDAEHETSNDSPLSKEEMAEVFGLSLEEFEEFIERTTRFKFDGSKLVVRPV